MDFTNSLWSDNRYIYIVIYYNYFGHSDWVLQLGETNRTSATSRGMLGPCDRANHSTRRKFPNAVQIQPNVGLFDFDNVHHSSARR